jgi:hypothetical protein
MLRRIMELTSSRCVSEEVPLFAPGAIERLETYQGYSAAAPYPHFVMDRLFNPEPSPCARGMAITRQDHRTHGMVTGLLKAKS